MVAIILLPGLDGSGALFGDFAAALGPGLQPVVVSYPKHQPLAYPELVQFVRSHLPPETPYILLGESFSGPVAILLAAARPAGLVGVVLCCTFARNPLPALWPLKSLLRFCPVNSQYSRFLMPLLFGRQCTAMMRSAVRRALKRVAADVVRKRLHAVLDVNVSEQLKQINVPVLYLRAAKDRIVPRSALRHIASLVPFAQSVTLQGPHMLLQALPSETAQIVTKFAEGTVAAFTASASQQQAQAASSLP